MFSKKPKVLDAVAESALRQNNMQMYTDLMKRELDHKNYITAVENALRICDEMNTSNLIPAQYYNLYLFLQQCLSTLDMYLRTEYIVEGNDILDLYERVQTFPNALSRLYLMVIIGTAAVKSKKVKILYFLRDIVEMSRAIQHPTKGIFLRLYILDCVRNILPDNTSEEDEGSIFTSIEFLMNNFSEMIKLLIRLQQSSKSEEQKSGEQHQLCQIVAKNMMILSNLEGVTVDIYSTNILPRFLAQVLLSRDKIAQDYLYDAIVQAFPTEYLLVTIHQLLHSLGGVVQDVGLRVILCNLMDRIVIYTKSNPDCERTLDMYEIFSSHIAEIIKTQNLSCEDYVKIFASLTKLAIVWHTEEEAYGQLNSINDNLYDYITTNQTFDENAASVLIEILKFPYEKYDFFKVLSLRVYPELINMLPYRMRHDMHRFVAKKMTEMKFIAKNADEISLIIRSIETLYKDAKDMFPLNDEELAVDCGLFKQCILDTDVNKETFFGIIQEIKAQVRYAGNRRTLMIMPTVIQLYLRAVPEMIDEKIKMFKQVHGLLKILYPLSHIVTLKCSTECGVVACKAEYAQASYFFEMALTNFEDNNDVPKEEALLNIVAALGKCYLPEEKTEIYLANCAKFVTLLNAPQQKGRVYCKVADSLFTAEQKKEAKIAAGYLQKAVKEAENCPEVEENIKLMIEILATYIDQFGRDNDEITVDMIHNIANVIKDRLAQNGDSNLQAKYDELVAKVAERPEEKVKSLSL